MTSIFNWIPAYAGMTIFLILFFLLPTAFARITPNDIYQEKRVQFETSLEKIQDPVKKEMIKKADQLLYDTNLKIALRFEEDVNKLAAIMEEIRRRRRITETRVAYGKVNTPIEKADYWVNYAAEAVAYQKIQDYTPYGVNETNISGPVRSSMNRMKSDYGVLGGKILRAKSEVEKVLNEN